MMEYQIGNRFYIGDDLIDGNDTIILPEDWSEPKINSEAWIGDDLYNQIRIPFSNFFLIRPPVREYWLVDGIKLFIEGINSKQIRKDYSVTINARIGKFSGVRNLDFDYDYMTRQLHDTSESLHDTSESIIYECPNKDNWMVIRQYQYSPSDAILIDNIHYLIIRFRFDSYEDEDLEESVKRFWRRNHSIRYFMKYRLARKGYDSISP